MFMTRIQRRIGKVSKLGIRLIILFHLVILLSGCYVLEQGYYQLNMLNAAVTFQNVLSNPNISQKVKKKILLVMEVKQFAIKELGLKYSKSYSSFVNIKNPYVAYNLSASRKDKLKPVLWKFPVIGVVPYLGFFQLADARIERDHLDKRGYDTLLRGVPAYSTLGFFGDPLLSTMLHYPDPVLIEIIIHEMTHETIFIKNYVKFNEALATFIGKKGSLLFIKKKYGVNSKWIPYMDGLNQDAILFSQFMEKMIKHLQKFYSQQIPVNEKISQRDMIFKKYQKYFQVNIKPQLKTNAYKDFYRIRLNNAIVLSFRRYYEDLKIFENIYNALDRDFSKTIYFFKQIERIKLDPNLYLRWWLKNKKNYNR